MTEPELTGGISLPRDLKHWLSGRVMTQQFRELGVIHFPRPLTYAYSEQPFSYRQTAAACSYVTAEFCERITAILAEYHFCGQVSIAAAHRHKNDAQGFILYKLFFFFFLISTAG